MELIQYNAALAITDAIRGSSREKRYQGLVLESLQQRRWYRNIYYFLKLSKNKSAKYLFNNMLTVRGTCRKRKPQFNVRDTFFKSSYLPSTVTEWNNLDKSIRNSESFFWNKFIRLSPSSLFNCHNPKEIKLLTRLRLDLSHLRVHKFKLSFQHSLSPICNCVNDVETTTHYLLSCPLFLMKVWFSWTTCGTSTAIFKF